MKLESTRALRPVSEAVKKAIGGLPDGAFNFGLYFQKWFYVVDGIQPSGKWNRGSSWACSLFDETHVAKKDDYCNPNKLLDNLYVSLALFNGEAEYRREKPKQKNGKWKPAPAEPVDLGAKWDRNISAGMLNSRQKALDEFAKTIELLGYTYIKVSTELLSPLIVGLGNEHPSEKGFRFDWTLGIPMIPSSSIKGVVRLAFLVNRLNSFEDPDDRSLLEFCHNIQKDETFPKPARSFFGSGGEKKATRGKVIFMDAYPEKLPRLKAEIMNCHYPDYLNKRTRGPTEDQDPNPQRYWAVDPDLDDKGTKVRFVFRFLIHKDIANDNEEYGLLLDAVNSALGDHGLGAKTAIGHGRFDTKGTAKPEKDRVKAPAEASPKDKPAADKVIEQWAAVNVNWDAGRQEVNATSGNKKGFTKDRSVVSEILCKTLFDKKKVVKANVMVEPLGGNNFRIIEVNPVDK